MNVLVCSAGRRCELLKYFKRSMDKDGKIVAVDLSPCAPALYYADKYYTVPGIDSTDYLECLTEICKKEKIDSIFTLIDPEISVLAQNKPLFASLGIKVFAPSYETARLCLDKLEMYRYLSRVGIPTVLTYGSFGEFLEAYRNKNIDFPVFIKPRKGSGSVGACRVDSMDELKLVTGNDPSYIIQEFVNGDDLDADVYVDMVSGELVSVFLKRKISVTIGGANKTVSFKDEELVSLIKKIAASFELCGAADMDFFYQNGKYVLSEINPRFGGAYLHAYGAGVDFIRLMENNARGIPNKPALSDYDEDIVMMMYDSVVIKPAEELAENLNGERI